MTDESRSQPWVARRGSGIVADAHVECGDEAFSAEAPYPVRERVRRFDGHAPDDHAIGAIGQHPLDVGGAPDAAARLDSRPARRGERAQHGVVGGDAVARPVEVDEVHAPRAGGGEALEQLRRRFQGAGLPLEGPLEEAHGAAAAQVDGGHEFHQPSPRKLARNREPSFAERSGWNCAPKKLSRQATAVKVSSYSQAATVSAPSGAQ